MPRITIECQKEVGKLTEIVQKTYEIPEYIFCDDDGSIMYYDSYHSAYFCRCCNNCVSATDYIKKQLEESVKTDKADDANINL